MIAQTRFKMIAISLNLVRISILFHLCLLIKGKDNPNNRNTTWVKNRQHKDCQNCTVNPHPVPFLPSDLPYSLESDFALKHIYDPTYVPPTPNGNPGSVHKNSYTDLGPADAMLEKLITLDFAGSATSDILTQTIDKNQVRSKWEAISNSTQNPGQKSITLIDNTNPAILLQDLNRTVPISGGRGGGQTFYQTKSEYHVTRVTLKYDPAVNADKIFVSREQFRSKLTLEFKTLLDGGEELIHLDEMNPGTRINGPDKVAEISMDRLKVLAESKSFLRTYLGVKNEQHLNMKRSDIKSHVQYSISCTRSMRRRRSTGSWCAFSSNYQDPELIRSSKRKLRQATHGLESFTLNHTMKDEALVTRQSMREHVNLIQAANCIQNPEQNIRASFQILFALDTKLKEQRLKLSQTAIAREMKTLANSKHGQHFLFKQLNTVTIPLTGIMLNKNMITGFIHGDMTSLGILAQKMGLYNVEGIFQFLQTNTISDFFESKGNTSLQKNKVDSKLLEPIEDSKLPEPTENSTLPEPTENSTLPETTENSTLPEPTENSTLPEPTENSTLPEPTENSKLPEPTEDTKLPVTKADTQFSDTKVDSNLLVTNENFNLSMTKKNSDLRDIEKVSEAVNIFKKLKSSMEILAGRAGPIGFPLDVSLSVLSVSKLIETLQNAAGNSKGNKTRTEEQNRNETRAEEPKGNETGSSESKGNETRAEESKGNETQADESKGNETRAEESKGNETQADESKGNETRAEESTGRDTGADESKGNDTGADESKGNDTSADESESNKNGTDESKANENGTDESKANENGTDESKANENGAIESTENHTDAEESKINDAIANLVANTVDIAVKMAENGSFIASSPAAPFIQSSVFINLTSYAAKIHKAIEETDRINKQMPILVFKKVEEYDNQKFHKIGTRPYDYIDRLVTLKEPITVNAKNPMETLKAHPELAGIIYPVRTATHIAHCRLTKSHFTWWLYEYFQWGSEEIMATDCPGPNSTCENIHRVGAYTKECVDGVYNKTFMNYDLYKCKCDVPIKQTFGHARENSLIDFTQKQNVYLERSVPDDVSGGTFKCKPGSIEDQGHKVSQRNTTYAYLCEATVALLRSNESSQISDEQVMLFLLEDGNDTVQLDPSSTENNHYEITNGLKEFYGGAGSDTFQLAGPCSSLSGTLDGREGQDTLIVTENCMNGYAIRLDFSKDGCTRFDSLDLYVNRIESLHGRRDHKEEVILSPAILYVNTKGGLPWDADIIKVPIHSSNYSTRIIASGNTEIILEATRGRISIEATDSGNNTISTRIFLPSVEDFTELSITTVIAELPSEFITLDYSRVISLHSKLLIFFSAKTNSMYSFEIQSPKPLASISADSTPELYVILKEDSAGSLSYLTMSPSPHIEPSIYHQLSVKSLNSTTLTSTKRIGSSNIKNIFDIKNGTWEVIGGDKDDEFTFYSNNGSWSIDGQEGNDLLQFDASLEHQHLDINLINGSCLKGRLRIANINTVIIPNNFSAHVTCGCDTMSVYSMGGSFLQQVVVPSSRCQNRSLEIHASGNSELSISDGGVTWPSYVFVNITSVPQQVKQSLNFTANIRSSPGIFVSVQHDGIDWVQDKAVAGSSSPGSGTYRVRLINPGEDLVDFTLNFPEIKAVTFDDDALFTQPSLKFQGTDGLSKGQLLIEKQNGYAKFLHILDSSDPDNLSKNRTGMLNLGNIFQIISSDPWNVVGGTQDDIFNLQITKFDGIVIDGGAGGENILTFPTVATSDLSILNIDVIEGTIKLGESSSVGVIKGIHHVVGRDKLPDIINVDCSVLTVNGQGGSTSPNASDPDAYADRINIQNTSVSNCSKPLRVKIFSHTILENSALQGDFNYDIIDAETSCLTFKSTEINSHNILFLQQPWEIIEKITLEASTSVLELQFKNGKVHVYPMANVQNGTFSNPDFKFHINDGSILCQLHVTPDGTTHTVYSISQFPSNGFVHGLPVTVNNFIINVTQEEATKSSSNCSLGIQGSNSAIHNYFFIYNLVYPIHVLDGKGSSNQLQIADEFYPNHTILFDMNPETGKLSVYKTTADILGKNKTMVIENVRNIYEFVGRKAGNDTVHPHCSSTSIVFVEEIVISHDPSCINGYNLSMEIGSETKIRFESGMGGDAEDHYPVEGAFHYRFTSPRTFDIEGRDNVDGMHFYYLPFTIDQLESLAFSKETETLLYSVRVIENDVQQIVNCSHKMIASLKPLDQFYPQPQLLTQDGFNIRISRTGEVTMIVGSEPYGNYKSATQADIQQKLVPLFLNITKRLEVTIIAGLSPEVVMHVGHGPSFKDRNVLQNSVNMTSHLVGGGANDTIYDIVDLRRDVYIYPGFDLDDCGRVDENDTKGQKQVIDLSDVVATIRQKYGNKYVPQTDSVGLNLAIKMIGHEDIYPGTVTIVDGTLCTSKLSLILYASRMSFKSSPAGQSLVRASNSQENISANSSSPDNAYPSIQWTITPDLIFVPQGYVYAISPEDLEIGHEIRFLTNSSEKRETTFEIARNHSDLFFTDIQAAESRSQILDTTTIVVAGFFNTRQKEDLNYTAETKQSRTAETALLNRSSKDRRNHDERLMRNAEPHIFNETPELLGVINVRVNLPGVNVVLNESVINPVSPIVQETAEAPIALQATDLNGVLHRVENIILRNYPDIQRDFLT